VHSLCLFGLRGLQSTDAAEAVRPRACTSSEAASRRINSVLYRSILQHLLPVLHSREAMHVTVGPASDGAAGVRS
jgi:hypothetical protein